MTLFPVVLPVADGPCTLSGRDKVARLSEIARRALRLSAGKSGVTLGELVKDGDDVPCPTDGIYWAVSHKPGCVAAVVSNQRAGIDVEEIRPRSEGIFDLVAGDHEWDLAGGRSWETFFRYWTAKEAVLKAVGVGIGGLRKCRVASVPDDASIVLDFRGGAFRVEQLYYNKYVVSVLKGDHDVEWVVAEGPGAPLRDRHAKWLNQERTP